MAVDFRTAKAILMNLLNVDQNGSYGTYDANDRYPEGVIDDAILNADLEVAAAIAKTDGHPRRSLYVSGVTINTDGAELPSSLGPVTPISIIRGDSVVVTPKHAPAEQQDAWRTFAANGIPVTSEDIDGYYEIQDRKVWFTGTSILVNIATVTRATVSGSPHNGTLNSPDEYLNGVICLGLAMLWAKDGDKPDIGSYYGRYGEMALQEIAAGKLTLPPMTAFSASRV